MDPQRPTIVDIHTHLYPPTYLSLLASRTTIPYLYNPRPSTTPPAQITTLQPEPITTTTPHPRLIILPSDSPPHLPPASHGRPLSPSYSSLPQKLSFMNVHHITTSILSLANPWLDFLPPDESPAWATKINNEFQSLCAESEEGRLYAFGTLPISGSVEDVCAEIYRLKQLSHVKGVILGTSGRGLGLDDPLLDPVWAALEATRTLIFLHPHYGLPSSVFGPRAHEYGHVLPLALGFPMETTVAVTRMLLCGVFDRFARLKVLLAHAGGTFPFLAGRVQSCVEHERMFRDAEGNMTGGRRGVGEVLRENVWVDAVTYGSVGTMAAVEGVGRERVLFGTDHPFFPPLGSGEGEDGEWRSVRTNVEAVEGAFGDDGEGVRMVLGGNAMRLFGLGEGEGR